MPTSIIPVNWELPAEILDRVGSSVGRQRSMVADGHLLIISHAPPRAGDIVRHERLFWRPPSGEWKSNEMGTGVHSIQKHIEEFARRTQDLDRRLEPGASAQELFELTLEITPLHRTAHNLQLALQQAREAFGTREIIDLRDHAVQVSRSLELLREEAKDALEYKIAAQAERQSRAANELARSAQRLNVMAAIFFPLVTVTGVFGMNLSSGLEGKGLFWVVVIGGLTAGILLWGVVLRRDPP